MVSVDVSESWVSVRPENVPWYVSLGALTQFPV